MWVVTESKTCYMYEAVLQTIKVAAHNLSEDQISEHNTMRLDIGLLLFERVWNNIKIAVLFLWDWSCIAALLPILITNFWRWDINKGAPGRGKRSRSIREDHGTLDFQHQILLWQSVHLWVIDVCCQGRWKPWVTDSGASTKTSCVGLWISNISSGQLIYIRWGLFRFESLCWVVPSRHHDNTGAPDRGTHLPAIS
jgi:hypothetical protein